MKRMMLLLAISCLVSVIRAQSPGTTFYGVESQPVCWTTSGGIDSSIYQVSLSAAATTKPTHIFFYVPITGTNRVQSVNVSGGAIRPGSCYERLQSIDNDTIINELDIIVNLLGGDTCQVLNLETVETLASSSKTYAAGSFASISVLNTSGTVTVTTGGDPASALPLNVAIDMSARHCRYFEKSVTVNAASGTALVVLIR